MSGLAIFRIENYIRSHLIYDSWAMHDIKMGSLLTGARGGKNSKVDGLEDFVAVEAVVDAGHDGAYNQHYSFIDQNSRAFLHSKSVLTDYTGIIKSIA